MKKRLLSMLLVSALSAGMVMGCSGDGSAENSAGSAQEDSASDGEEQDSYTIGVCWYSQWL